MNSAILKLSGVGIGVAIVFVLSFVLMETAVPQAEAWSAANCSASADRWCPTVNAFIAWWWAAVVVASVPLAIFSVRYWSRRLGLDSRSA